MGCLFIFRSITQAQSAERVLAKNGMIGYIVKPPTSLGHGSCAYGVKVRNNCEQAIGVIRSSGLQTVKIWRAGNRGYAEVQL